MSGLTVFQLWIITVLSIAITFTVMAQRGLFDQPPQTQAAPAPDAEPIPSYGMGWGG